MNTLTLTDDHHQYHSGNEEINRSINRTDGQMDTEPAPQNIFSIDLDRNFHIPR